MGGGRVELSTIGFTKKSAERFFDLLKNKGVRLLIDTRISNGTQLSGFAKGPDLAYFAREIAGIEYRHDVQLAPTKALLDQYRNKKLRWDEYEVRYLDLLDERKIDQDVALDELHQGCFLCSEHGPEKCHRRLLAEYLQQKHPEIRISHLK